MNFWHENMNFLNRKSWKTHHADEINILKKKYQSKLRHYDGNVVKFWLEITKFKTKLRNSDQNWENSSKKMKTQTNNDSLAENNKVI